MWKALRVLRAETRLTVYRQPRVCFFVSVSRVRVCLRSVRVCVQASLFVRERAYASMLTCLRAHVDLRAFLGSVCVRAGASTRLLVRLFACPRSSSGD